MDLIKILLILAIASIIPGQIARIPISGQESAITLTDIFVFILAAYAVPYLLMIKKTVRISPPVVTTFFLFTIVATASMVMAANKFDASLIISSSLFLVRFIVYFLVSLIIATIVKRNEIERWLNIFITCGVVFTLLGFVQLGTFPDISALTPFGWDPHQARIVSTLIDPNFTGALLTILASTTSAIYLYKKRAIYLVVAIIFFSGIVFTFSRSSYLALLVLLVVLGLFKSPKFVVGASLIFLLVVTLNNQARERIIGAITLDETAKARLESYSRAITIFKNNPILGVGFNTYRYAQDQYGFFTIDAPLGGHSGSGSDSSLLLVAATTGVVGFATFTFFIISIIRSISFQIKSNFLHLGTAAAFLALLVHSQFVNSFFFPQIMLPIWFLLGLVQSENS